MSYDHFYFRCFTSLLHWSLILFACNSLLGILSDQNIRITLRNRNLTDILLASRIYFNLLYAASDGSFISHTVFIRRPTHPSIMMPSSSGNIFGVTGPLCGEFTGHR